MPDQAFERLAALLKEAGMTVEFGLEAQGCRGTIERMLADGADWQAIGKAIGWAPKTAEQHWRWAQEDADGEALQPSNPAATATATIEPDCDDVEANHA